MCSEHDVRILSQPQRQVSREKILPNSLRHCRLGASARVLHRLPARSTDIAAPASPPAPLPARGHGYPSKKTFSNRWSGHSNLTFLGSGKFAKGWPCGNAYLILFYICLPHDPAC